ncbi:SGNH/GDSL hydrolase family protein [Priestia megaterium]|uniref:SGNH/GDSL hydrolase family protein n=1 Tax=Priestia megaterium TaxID=1404 RepID=UPI000BFBE666|nr:SGNH/GDSL hydrolase family protein [Priestia megaterium]PGR00704.1 hypothetical protein COA23_24215 [Priestia megaterium]
MRYRLPNNEWDVNFAEDYSKNLQDIDRDITQVENTSRNIQQQVDVLVTEGDSSPAADQARVDLEGIVHNSLKKRLDSDAAKVLSKADLSYVETMLATAVSGAPKGFYNTLTSLKNAYPQGTDGIFLVLENGHIYIWSGTDWSDAGLYQSTGIANDSVSNANLKSTDRVYHANFANCTGKAGATLWISKKTYEPGYIESITFLLNAPSDSVTFSVFEYTKNTDGTYNLTRIYTKAISNLPAGESTIDIGLLCRKQVFIGIGDTSGALAFSSGGSYPTHSAAFTSTSLSNVSFNVNNGAYYQFGYSINMRGIKTTVLNLLKLNQNLLFEHSLLMKKTSSGSITIDFENMVLKITDMYICKKKTSSDNVGVAGYQTISLTSTINALPAEGYYVMYVVYNSETTAIEMIYSNGETLNNFPTDDQTLKYSLICGGLTDGKTYFNFISSPNNKFVTTVLKQNLNTDDGTTTTDIIIPKFGERLYLTEDKQMNKWFNTIVNIIGDSVVKGENSADSYRRMKNDNIASILREEFGFATARNYGIGGSRITTHSDANFAKKGMVDRYGDMGAADLNILWGGTNDFGGNVPMGSLSDLTDNTKFKPAFYNLVNGLLTKYPGKQLLILTPMHRKDSKPENVANAAGLLLKDYRDAEIEICEMLGVPYLDMWSELGFTPFNDSMKTTYMPDGLHPSIEGMRKYVGRRICNKVRAL